MEHDEMSPGRFGALLLTVLSIVLCSASCSTEPTGPRYNVVLITLDTTRADRLSSYGHFRRTSPRLDALADDGTRFDMAISTSAVTPMSHASILTGLNPDRHGLRVFYGLAGSVLPASRTTLADLLAERGWTTAAFVSAYPASERFGLDSGFERFDTGVDPRVMTMDPSRRPPKDGFWLDRREGLAQRRADATTEDALDWLEGATRPFFLWTHYFDPHDPSLVPPPDVVRQFGADPRSPDSYREIYDPEIYFMDMQIGRLIDALKRSGEYERTVFVVVADHGQGLGDHGWFAHRLLYQEQIRVPMILRFPGGPTGQVIDDLARTIDIVPTVLELLELDVPDAVQGRSLLPLVRGTGDEPRLAYAEALNTLDYHAPRDLPPQQKDRLHCMTDGDWKLIYHHDSPEHSELYNLDDDPRETRNVADLHPAQAARLLSALEASGAMHVEIVKPEGPLDPEALEKLESLGYVGN
jgi:arylsulfatase A-like enzyme